MYWEDHPTRPVNQTCCSFRRQCPCLPQSLCIVGVFRALPGAFWFSCTPLRQPQNPLQLISYRDKQGLWSNRHFESSAVLVPPVFPTPDSRASRPRRIARPVTAVKHAPSSTMSRNSCRAHPLECGDSATARIRSHAPEPMERSERRLHCGHDRQGRVGHHHRPDKHVFPSLFLPFIVTAG
jgi:hypothetical protein